MPQRVYANGGPERVYLDQLRPRDGTTVALALLPTTIESSGGALTSWLDVSGHRRHGTPTGGPTVSTVSGLPCVVFDGVNDRVDGSIALPDQPCTVFLLRKNADTSPGGRRWIWSTTDTGAGLRGNGVLTAFSSVVGRQEAVADTGNAQSATTTNLEVVRVDFDTDHRKLFVNGAWYSGGSNCIHNTSVRNLTAWRLGNEAGGGFAWAGSICAVLVVEGRICRKEKERIEGVLMDMAGIARPFAWPLATVPGSQDPRIILPDVAHCVVGRPVKINKFSAIYWTGAHPSLSATCDLPFDRAPSRYWQVTPPAPGDYEFTLTAGSYSKTTILRAVAMPAAGKRYFLCVGDSRTNRGGAGWIELLGRLLGSSLAEFVGTVGPQAGFSFTYYGVDSKRWADFDSSDQQFYNGGVLDIAHYRTLLAHDPTDIIWSLGQNDVYPADDGTIEATIDTTFGHVDNLLAGWTASIPTVRHWLAYNWPLAMDPALWGGGGATSRDGKRRMVHRYAERLAATYSGREGLASPVFLIPRTYTEVDTVKGVEDAIHENRGPGHLDLMEAYLGALAGHW